MLVTPGGDYFVGSDNDTNSVQGTNSDVSSTAGSGSDSEFSGEYDFENGLGDYTTLGSGVVTADYTGPNSEDYYHYNGGDNESQDESSLNLNGTTFVIIINDNDNINSVSLASPDKFLSIIRPSSDDDDVGNQWSETSGTNKLSSFATAHIWHQISQCSQKC